MNKKLMITIIILLVVVAIVAFVGNSKSGGLKDESKNDGGKLELVHPENSTDVENSSDASGTWENENVPDDSDETRDETRDETKDETKDEKNDEKKDNQKDDKKDNVLKDDVAWGEIYG